jgi:hypothetical protein
MKPTMLLGLSVGALLVPVALWQQPPKEAPILPLATPVRTVQVITKLPFTIDAPGRYVLAGSMTAEKRPPRGFGAGIVIQADHVELDLDGFVLMGAEGATIGIVAMLPEKRAELLRDVCVRNGGITGWAGGGVDLAAVEGARLLDLRVSYNGVADAAAAGLRTGAASVVQGCTAMGNTGAGISVGERSLVGDCLSDLNGLEGFVLGGLASARRCSATKNLRDGFQLSGGGCSLVDCSAGGNTGRGIHAALTAHVRACSAAGNAGAGVAVGRGSLVTECAASGNGGAGIWADEGLCRIEGNHLVLNGSGFSIAGAGNVVARNTVSDPEGGLGLLSGSGPGGVFLPDPTSLRLSIAGVGSIDTRSEPTKPEVVKDGGLLTAWANIVVK